MKLYFGIDVIYVVLGLICPVILQNVEDKYTTRQKNEHNKISEDNSRYKTIQANTTLIKLLINHENDNITKSEIFDMLHSKDGDFFDTDVIPTFQEDEEDMKTELPDDPNLQSEFIQPYGSQVIKDWDDSVLMQQSIRVAALRSKIAVITIFITVAIVLIAYAILIIYRRIEIRNHKMKHFLLDEEEGDDTRIEL